MTLVRDGWIDGRPYAVVPQRGEPEKYVCLDCEGELPPDADVFEGHHCANFENTELTTVDATEAAIELARERGVTLSELEGTGTDGRILKSDVQEQTEA